MIPASSGRIFMNGYDIINNPDQRRKNIGLCPQDNVIIKEFTPVQNLIFFGMVDLTVMTDLGK